MNRRAFLQALAAFGVAAPAASLLPDAHAATVNAALRRIAATPWWAPVVRAWTVNRHAEELQDLCWALEVPHGLNCCAEGDVAIARLVLGHVQDELPQWYVGTRAGITVGRREFPAVPDAAASLETHHVCTINWATSGPGYQWPESYYITNVEDAGVWVATASRDCPDGFGCTDHAVGWLDIRVDRDVAAKKLVMADWNARVSEFDQWRWEDFLEDGLMSEEEAEGIADEVWE